MTEDRLGKIIRRIPTGVFITPEETNTAIQNYGMWQENKTDANWKIHEEYYKSLAQKYGFVWNETEISPSGEVIHVVREKQ